MTTGDSERPFMGPLPDAPGCNCQICRPEESYEPFDRKVVETVLEHGWQVLLVEAEECEHHDHEEADHGANSPAFGYTVGLGHRCGHPELMISGLDRTVMHNVLNDVAGRVMRGQRLSPGDALENVLAGVPVALERVAEVGLTVTYSG